jgi:hypothetical protein
MIHNAIPLLEKRCWNSRETLVRLLQACSRAVSAGVHKRQLLVLVSSLPPAVCCTQAEHHAVTALSVTDNHGGSGDFSSLLACLLFKKHGAAPLVHLLQH